MQLQKVAIGAVFDYIYSAKGEELLPRIHIFLLLLLF